MNTNLNVSENVYILNFLFIAYAIIAYVIKILFVL